MKYKTESQLIGKASALRVNEVRGCVGGVVAQRPSWGRVNLKPGGGMVGESAECQKRLSSQVTSTSHRKVSHRRTS